MTLCGGDSECSFLTAMSMRLAAAEGLLTFTLTLALTLALALALALAAATTAAALAALVKAKA